jgi:hypothetical protein
VLLPSIVLGRTSVNLSVNLREEMEVCSVTSGMISGGK